MVPGLLAPVTSTGVPTGSEPESQPLVSVLPPVPEQWAAWPMYVFEASVKTKFAVHWAPSVKVCTPGWTVAVEAVLIVITQRDATGHDSVPPCLLLTLPPELAA